ncbi:MAG: cytidylate kinase-like family protein [Candidatus Omnitrophica bacterium]|nr:cytidylate kinase-like family protein [Candidatus Omnitrophota bacterium]
MNEETAFERCKAFIDCQLQSAKGNAAGATCVPSIVTIARDTGCGALAVAEKLAAFLNRNDSQAKCPWTYFDKNLVERVLKEHHLPQRMAQYMTEEKVSELDDAVAELLGLHPSMWTLVHYTIETILHLAQLGNVILVGHGATAITSKFKGAFHVRLVGTLDRRAERIQESLHLSRNEASEYVKREDRRRRRFYKSYFELWLDDPLLYHLIINTDRVSSEEAGRLIGESVLLHRSMIAGLQNPLRSSYQVNGHPTTAGNGKRSMVN